MFRLSKDNAAINRLGFNGKGLGPYVKRISQRGPGLGPFGANIGKNKVTEDGAADYEIGIEAVAAYADYLVCNISSPNTPGLRAMQGRAIMSDMIERSLQARARAVPEEDKRPPMIIKIAPDLDEAERADIAAVIIETGVDGMIVANTTVLRPSQMTDLQWDSAAPHCFPLRWKSPAKCTTDRGKGADHRLRGCGQRRRRLQNDPGGRVAGAALHCTSVPWASVGSANETRACRFTETRRFYHSCGRSRCRSSRRLT